MKGVLAAITFAVLALIVVVFGPPISPILGTTCTLGVTGTAASVTVQGWGAQQVCQQALVSWARNPTATQLYESTQTRTEPIVCEYTMKGQSILSDVHFVVRDEGTLKLVGNALCAYISNMSKGASPYAVNPAPPTQEPNWSGPTAIPEEQAWAEAIATRNAEATPTPVPTLRPRPSAIPSTSNAAQRAPSVSQIGLEMSRTVEADDQSEHFTPGQPITISDGQVGTLTAIVGTRYPTADGYGQLVFFWHNDTFLGWNATRETMSIQQITSTVPGTFDVTYEHYAPNDSACCPSLPPVTVTYRWNGTALISSGDPPNLLSSVKLLP